MCPIENNEYLRNRILQAPQEQLQLMLYDGAIKFATQGREALERKDYERVYNNLSRAQNIILEMQAGLRPEVHPQICEQMSSLYGYIYRKLISAGVNRDPGDVDDALKILQHQRETWVMLLEQLATSGEPSDDNSQSDESELPAGIGSLSIEG